MKILVIVNVQKQPPEVLCEKRVVRNFTNSQENICVCASLFFNKVQFARIYTSSLIKIKKILNRSITKFYNSDDVNVIAAELRLT